MFRIKYGTRHSKIDITQIAMEKCVKNDILFITRCGNTRNILFTDPLHGTEKSIFVEIHNQIQEYSKHNVFIDIPNNTVYDDVSVPTLIERMFDITIEPKIIPIIISVLIKIS